MVIALLQYRCSGHFFYIDYIRLYIMNIFCQKPIFVTHSDFIIELKIIMIDQLKIISLRNLK